MSDLARRQSRRYQGDCVGGSPPCSNLATQTLLEDIWGKGQAECGGGQPAKGANGKSLQHLPKNLKRAVIERLSYA